LVYGWYGESCNLGDNLFKQAFIKLFPDYSFIFVDRIETFNLQNCDAVFFGGGSFLDNPIQINNEAKDILYKKPILYIGVGLETNIHPDHIALLLSAKLIASRNICEINLPIINIPDLVYALNGFELSDVVDNTLLFLPNSFLLPKNIDLNWKFAAWNYFKSEVSQFLDELVDEGWSIHFYPMCQAEAIDDSWAANEIISMMNKGKRSMLIKENLEQMPDIIKLFSGNSIIFTQRYHGAVLASLSNRPYVSIAHHDKMEQDISYYGITKNQLKKALSKKNNTNYIRSFDILQREVTNIIGSICPSLGTRIMK
jgi:hypothetical protein